MKEKCGLQMKRTIISLAIWLCAIVAYAEGSESVMLPSDRNHLTDATESRIGKRIDRQTHRFRVQRLRDNGTDYKLPHRKRRLYN